MQKETEIKPTIKNIILQMIELENSKVSKNDSATLLTLTPEMVVNFIQENYGLTRSVETVERYLKGELSPGLLERIDDGSWRPVSGGFHPVIDPASHIYQVSPATREKQSETEVSPGKTWRQKAKRYKNA